MRNFWQQFKSYCSWENLNPLNWSCRELKMFLGSFFAIMLPIYLFIGLQPVPAANADGLPHLSIPSIALDTPVVSIELNNRELIAPDTIAGIYASSNNKLFVIGHSSTVFQKLNQIKIDDIFTYNNTAYRVKQLETLPKSDISMTKILQPETMPTLIIMTCAGTPLPNQDATHRLIVTATQATI